MGITICVVLVGCVAFWAGFKYGSSVLEDMKDQMGAFETWLGREVGSEMDKVKAVWKQLKP
jgi:hypothetical protein